MRGPKPQALTLSEKEQNDLEALVRRHSTPQQVVLRGRMILAVADGKNNSQSARSQCGYGEKLAYMLDRFEAVSLEEVSVSERLWDVPYLGWPSQITAEQSCQIVALACEQPKERPISQWTGREIADEVVRRGILPQISPRHASRVLKKGSQTPFDPLLVDLAG